MRTGVTSLDMATEGGGAAMLDRAHHPQLPAAEGKREPNTLSMAMSSTLGVGRQLLYLMDKEAGAKFKLVVFKGGGEATTAAAGGHVSFTAENLSEMAGHVQGGKLRAIAVTGEKRMPALPDTPTLVELGHPSMVLTTGRGFSMPAAVPKEAAATMEAIPRKLLPVRDPATNLP